MQVNESHLATHLGALHDQRVVLGACLIHGLTLAESTLTIPESDARSLKNLVLELVDSCDVDEPFAEASFGFSGSGSFYVRAKNQVIIAVHHLHSADADLIKQQANEVLKDVLQGKPESLNGFEDNSWPKVEPQNEIPAVIDNSKPRTTDPFPDMFRTRKGANETAGDQERDALPPRAETPAETPPESGMMLRKKSSASEARTVMPWAEFSEELQLILSKVMGDAQASQMVRRHLANYEIDEEADFRIPDLMQFGTEILERVPNKIKRNSLLDELNRFLNS